MSIRAYVFATALCLAVALGCGPAPSQVETLNAGSEQLFTPGDAASPGALTAHQESAALARFWAVDRFLLDGEFGVPIVRAYDSTLLAKAKPDECFNGVGKTIGKPDADGKCAEGQPKVNDAYVWGLTRIGTNLFFGTLANTLCLVESGFLRMDTAQTTALWVCEFDESLSGTGDFRAPNAFKVDLTSGKLVSLNPLDLPVTSDQAELTKRAAAEGLRRGTTGLRSAGAMNGVAFLAGPGARGGVNFFAYDGDGNLLGSYRYATLLDTDVGLTNVRQWVVANGGLYVGVGTRNKVTGAAGGAVLRWNADTANLFAFTEVGYLPDDAANMIFHTDGRIYVTTWPGTYPAGLYRSPVLPTGGLGTEHAKDLSWKTPLWLATSTGLPEHANVPSYDPDRLTGSHVGGGALASYKGRIYFGTMSVPFVAAQDAVETYGLGGDLLRTALGTHRSIALFEVKFPAGRRPLVSMIFGEKYLPIYESGGYTIRYDKAHRTGFEPRWGSSGFGNFFNTYTWAMAVHRGEVFVGTFDWSQLARAMLETVAGDPAKRIELAPVQAALLDRFGTGLPREGADLIRFSDSRVVAESATGLGNDRNYGVRNLLTDGTTLYVGTANPMNLDARGGWELRKLTPR